MYGENTNTMPITYRVLLYPVILNQEYISPQVHRTCKILGQILSIRQNYMYNHLSFLCFILQGTVESLQKEMREISSVMSDLEVLRIHVHVCVLVMYVSKLYSYMYMYIYSTSYMHSKWKCAVTTYIHMYMTSVRYK